MLSSHELAEVLKRYPDLVFNIDLWDGDRGLNGTRFICNEVCAGTHGVSLVFEFHEYLSRNAQQVPNILTRMQEDREDRRQTNPPVKEPF